MLDEPLTLLVGVLSEMERVLGEKATASLVEFAASETARSRVASLRPRADFAIALADLGPLVGSRFEVVEAGPRGATVRVEWPLGAAAGSEVARSLLTGLVKGAYVSAFSSRSCRMEIVPESECTALVLVKEGMR